MRVIYGDDFEDIKTRLLDLIDQARKKGVEIEWCRAKDIDSSKLLEFLSGSDLFGQKKMIFLEGLSEAFKGKKRDEVRKILKDNDNSNLVVGEVKFDARFYQGLEVQKEEIKLPALIFAYLDSLGGQSGITLKNYMAVVATEPAEKVFRMTVLRLQDLLRAKSNPRHFDTSKFYFKKIVQQASKIPEERILSLYFQLYEMEREVKSGLSPVDMTGRLELFWQLYRL